VVDWPTKIKEDWKDGRLQSMVDRRIIGERMIVIGPSATDVCSINHFTNQPITVFLKEWTYETDRG
jgi:hypothetical protein